MVAGPSNDFGEILLGTNDVLRLLSMFLWGLLPGTDDVFRLLIVSFRV